MEEMQRTIRDTLSVYLSVIICTYNRSSLLEDSLISYLETEFFDDPSVELIVVDNNSTDDTEKVVRRFMSRNLCIRYVKEENQGLSYARNRGIEEAKGEVLAFVDDDVFFDKNWVSAVLEEFKKGEAPCCIGGKVVPHFENDMPGWIRRLPPDLRSLVYMYLGVPAEGDVENNFDYPDHPFGVNMACRKSVFSEVGGFTVGLGRIGTNLLSGEETEFFYRVHRIGCGVKYVPRAKILHRVPEARTKPEWFILRQYWQGRSMVVVRCLIGEIDSRRKLLREAVLSAYKLCILYVAPLPHLKKAYWYWRSPGFGVAMEMARHRGRLLECLRSLIKFSDYRDTLG